jgi:hypothetical protein
MEGQCCSHFFIDLSHEVQDFLLRSRFQYCAVTAFHLFFQDCPSRPYIIPFLRHLSSSLVPDQRGAPPTVIPGPGGIPLHGITASRAAATQGIQSGAAAGGSIHQFSPGNRSHGFRVGPPHQRRTTSSVTTSVNGESTQASKASCPTTLTISPLIWLMYELKHDSKLRNETHANRMHGSARCRHSPWNAAAAQGASCRVQFPAVAFLSSRRQADNLCTAGSAATEERRVGQLPYSLMGSPSR